LFHLTQSRLFKFGHFLVPQQESFCRG